MRRFLSHALTEGKQSNKISASINIADIQQMISIKEQMKAQPVHCTPNFFLLKEMSRMAFLPCRRTAR